MKKAAYFLLILTVLLNSAENLYANEECKNKFEAKDGSFLLNGEPYIIKAAELHYPRIPQEYWEHRIKMAKALGMNTICLYTFWNIHEQKEGEFDFTQQNDLRKFVNLCQDNDMKVILRPGPYVCAEWEMGGLPWWLLKNKDIRLRENDPVFIEKVERFQNAVAQQVGDLTIEHGGPIIMIQVENEYGAYGEDKEYVNAIRDILKRNFGNEILMFQCDWSSNFTLNGLDDLLWTMNFGTGADIDSQFAELKKLRPDTPLMCSEFWSGWFDKWGEPHETRPANEMVEGIDEMLSKGISFSLYMTHGGTNWGHWAGANSPGYSPDVTSYDYDAPISENGSPTVKYRLLRNVMSRYLKENENLADMPDPIIPTTIAKFDVVEVAPIWENLQEPIQSEEIMTMEECDMGFGSILYSTVLPINNEEGELIIIDPHDYAQIFINGKYLGKLDRRKNENTIKISDLAEGDRLDILVEATGRINFGRAIKDYKGITEKVVLKSENQEIELKDWNIRLFPDELAFYENLKYQPVPEARSESKSLPRGAYRGKFNIDKPSDTYMNFESWGKGLVYINGYAIGRFWNEGPQQTLYVPGPWLRQGENEILVFDIIGPDKAETEGLEEPIIDKIKYDLPEIENSIPIGKEEMTHILSSIFSSGNGWKEIKLDSPVKSRYLRIEILNTHDGEIPAISELYLLGENGLRTDREKWVLKSDSENREDGNHDIGKIYDLQESTYWQPLKNNDNKHFILIDLGKVEEIKGIQYLPRMEAGAPGGIKDFQIYVFN